MSDVVVNRPFAGPPFIGWRTSSAGAGVALHLAGIGALTLVLASSGAFDSDQLPFARRALMFGTVSALLIIQTSVLGDAARRLAGSGRIRRGGAAAVALAATALLMTVEIHALKWTPVIPYTPDPLPRFALFLAPFVLPVGGVVLGLKWFGSASPESALLNPGQRAPTSGDHHHEPGAAAADWPTDAVRRVQALDHYLHIWTEGRTRLVRGRMRDALRWFPDGAGIQPHRSWWIARSEIARLDRCGRDHSLVLRDGGRIPVARGRIIAVKRFLDAGM